MKNLNDWSPADVERLTQWRLDHSNPKWEDAALLFPGRTPKAIAVRAAKIFAKSVHIQLQGTWSRGFGVLTSMRREGINPKDWTALILITAVQNNGLPGTANLDKFRTALNEPKLTFDALRGRWSRLTRNKEYQALLELEGFVWSSFDGWKYEPREDTESDVPGEVPSLSHGLSAGNVS